MLGKALWKMYYRPADNYKQQATKPTVKMVLNAFKSAIRTVPKPRDSRQEPILEPHYKLLATVHKMIMMRAIEPQFGADLLQKQPFAIRKGEFVEIASFEDWDSFALESLKHLRTQDKQHWQHRMVFRVATIVFDEGDPSFEQASTACKEFRESIFTKTMHIQVWKPDAERPGRHCVYMERYVALMMKILFIMNDKVNMEALCKRVRKKSNDFQNFTKVWTDCCTTYLKLIRRIGQIPPNMDEVFKSVSQEEFAEVSQKIETWVNDPTQVNPALEALREAIELKKTNANLIKTLPVDDLINDAWGVLYIAIVKELPPAAAPGSLQQAQIDASSDSRPIEPRPVLPGPMSINNVMDSNGQQPTVSLTPAPAEVARPRKLGISRREVLRRAEAAVTRTPEPSRNIAPFQPSAEGSGVATPPNLILGSNAPPVSQQKGKEASGKEGNRQGRERGSGGSRRQSVDDDADDESDLSDVPDIDDREAAMLFPNLMRRTTTEDGGDDKSSTVRDN